MHIFNQRTFLCALENLHVRRATVNSAHPVCERD